jgi:hypothetical protein
MLFYLGDLPLARSALGLIQRPPFVRYVLIRALAFRPEAYCEGSP